MYIIKRYTLFLLIPLLLLTISCQKSETTKTEEEKNTGLEVDEPAPDFSLRNQDQLKIVLSEFKGKKNVILVFYPLDFTPV